MLSDLTLVCYITKGQWFTNRQNPQSPEYNPLANSAIEKLYSKLCKDLSTYLG